VKDPEFGAFIKKERQRFISFVRARLRDASELDAEDVLQDVLVRLLGKPSLRLPLDRMTAYIYSSLQNRVIDLLRARGRYVSLDDDGDESGDEPQTRLLDLLSDVSPNPLELLQSAEGKRVLFEALDNLGAIERQVVIAHELEGSSFKELASRLRIPLNTLLSHQARAMKKLEKHFQADKEQP
jgi:RNA polymerase sigma-70 factor (ECF subfamily)